MASRTDVQSLYKTQDLSSIFKYVLASCTYITIKWNGIELNWYKTYKYMPYTGSNLIFLMYDDRIMYRTLAKRLLLHR